MGLRSELPVSISNFRLADKLTVPPLATRLRRQHVKAADRYNLPFRLALCFRRLSESFAMLSLQIVLFLPFRLSVIGNAP